MSLKDSQPDRYKVIRNEVVAKFETYKPILDRVCAHIQSELPHTPIMHDKTETNECGQTSICNFIDDITNLVLTADNEADAFRKMWCLFHGEKITRVKSDEKELVEIYAKAAVTAQHSSDEYKWLYKGACDDLKEMQKVSIS